MSELPHGPVLIPIAHGVPAVLAGKVERQKAPPSGCPVRKKAGMVDVEAEVDGGAAAVVAKDVMTVVQVKAVRCQGQRAERALGSE